jgi:hypothetical protein
MTKRSFTEVILLLYGFIFIVIGIGLLCFTKEVTLFTFVGTPAHVLNVMHQFLGAAYLLIGLLMFTINILKGKQLYFAIAAINLIGFINLYLIFIFNELIVLPSIYFIFQAIIQITLVLALYEQVKRN